MTKVLGDGMSEITQSKIGSVRKTYGNHVDMLLAEEEEDYKVIEEEAAQREKKRKQIFVTLTDLEKMNVKTYNRNMRTEFKPKEFLVDSDEER